MDITTGATVSLTPERGVRAYVQEIGHRAPREMLFGHNARDGRFSDLYRVDVVTGQSRLVFENTEFAWLVTDAALRPGSRRATSPMVARSGSSGGRVVPGP